MEDFGGGQGMEWLTSYHFGPSFMILMRYSLTFADCSELVVGLKREALRVMSDVRGMVEMKSGADWNPN